MQVTLLGTGCPVADPRRHGAATLIEAGGARLLVDCGSGVTQRLVEAGIPPAAIDTVLVTHLHSDHLVDLWQLCVAGWHGGRERPLRVLGPEPVLRHARAIEAAWADERAQRIAFERRANAAALALAPEPVAAGQLLTLGALEVEIVPVDHRPVEPAFGLIARAGGHSVAVSGDTRYCPALVAAARGCEVLVHEAFVHDALIATPGTRSAATVAAVRTYHTSPAEAGRAAAEAGVACLVLTHIVPPRADPAAIVAEARTTFAGPIVVAEDLTRLDLATRTLAWRGLHIAWDAAGGEASTRPP